MKKLIRTALIVALGASLVSCGTRRLDLTRPETQLQVGVDMAKSELWREAAFRFEKAVQLSPSDAMARNNLAVAYEGTGDFDKAREQYTEALRLDRGNEYIQRNYSRFIEFYQRNREPAAAPTSPAAPAAAETEESPEPPVRVPDEPELPEVPPPTVQPDPPEPPVSSPPSTREPDPGAME